MDIALAMKEALQTATEHGLWPVCPDPRERYILLHSELSEALKEAQQGRPMYYSNPDNPAKPEGIGIKLIDCVIRAFEFMEYYGAPYIPKSQRAVPDVTDDKLPILIYKLHTAIDSATDPNDPVIDFDKGTISDERDLGYYLSTVIDMIFGWLRFHGASPEVFLKEKTEFNKNQPNKHDK